MQKKLRSQIQMRMEEGGVYSNSLVKNQGSTCPVDNIL